MQVKVTVTLEYVVDCKSNDAAVAMIEAMERVHPGQPGGKVVELRAHPIPEGP
jgi:hypothetical protein